jgi:hypothetical protein
METRTDIINENGNMNMKFLGEMSTDDQLKLSTKDFPQNAFFWSRGLGEPLRFSVFIDVNRCVLVFFE